MVVETYLDKESDGLSAIQESVVVSQCKVHHLFDMSNHSSKVITEQHTGRISTLPFTATGLSLIACRPSTAARSQK